MGLLWEGQTWPIHAATSQIVCWYSRLSTYWGKRLIVGTVSSRAPRCPVVRSKFTWPRRLFCCGLAPNFYGDLRGRAPDLHHLRSDTKSQAVNRDGTLCGQSIFTKIVLDTSQVNCNLRNDMLLLIRGLTPANTLAPARLSGRLS